MEHSTYRARERAGAEISSVCPDCGQVLVRPADFSGERLLYLHRKWGACLPMGRPAPAARVESITEADSPTRLAAG